LTSTSPSPFERKADAPPDQLLAQLTVVVDLAIEYGDVAPAVAAQRLLTARNVDDAQAAHAEANMRIAVIARIVGATPTSVSVMLPEDLIPQHLTRAQSP
jgi:hypothetical protein